LLALLLTGLSPLRGQEEQLPLDKEEQPPIDKEEQLTKALFESETEKELKANIAAARQAKFPEQAILEARFLFLVDQQDFAAVAALAPALEGQKEKFRIEDSVIFSVPEEFLAIIKYSHALASLEKGDQAGFKTHIMEAFWLSPRQAAVFAPHIERLRLAQEMAKIKIDFQKEYRSQKSDKMVSLAALARKSKHVVLHFWSPWSSETEASLPDFIAMAQELARNDIAIVSILIEPGAEALKVAREFRAGIKENGVGEWIVDNSEFSLARKLRIQDLPTVTLISAQGGVLFNGHPSDDGLWDALRKVVPKVKRPRLKPLN